MKKISILILFFFNLSPVFKDGAFSVSAGSLYAQGWGDEEMCGDQDPMEEGEECGSICDPASSNYDYEACNNPCNEESPNYDSFECMNPCNELSPNFNLTLCFNPCSPYSPNYDPIECEARKCDPLSPNYSPSECEDSECDPSSPNYDPYYCAGSVCDPSSPSYDPQECEDAQEEIDNTGGSGGGDPPGDPPVTPCDNFKKWVTENFKEPRGTYYDNNKSLSYKPSATPPPANCETGLYKPPLGQRYWYVDSISSNYRYDPLIGAKKWVKYDSCGVTGLPVTFSFTKTIMPPSNTDTRFQSNWCAFANLVALTGGDPCTFAKYYYKTFNVAFNTTDSCLTNVATIVQDIPAFYGHYGFSVTSLSSPIVTECQLIQAMNGGGKALSDYSSNHVSLIYGVHRDKNGTVSIDKFNTESSVWNQTKISFSNYHQGGPDYVVQ